MKSHLAAVIGLLGLEVIHAKEHSEVVVKPIEGAAGVSCGSPAARKSKKIVQEYWTLGLPPC